MDFIIITAFLGKITTPSSLLCLNTKKNKKKTKSEGAIIIGETTSLSHTHTILSEREKVITRELYTHTPSAFRRHKQRVTS